MLKKKKNVRLMKGLMMNYNDKIKQDGDNIMKNTIDERPNK